MFESAVCLVVGSWKDRALMIWTKMRLSEFKSSCGGGRGS